LRGKEPRLESYRETLGRIVEQARDMSRLIDDLMFLARSETDDARFDNDELELADIVVDAVGEIQTLGRARGIQIATRLPADNVTVAGDRQRMKQLNLILLDNAVKYAPPHSAVIVTIAADDGAAVMRIRNRGGISGEDMPRLFERFYRGRDLAARSTGGSGLGLAIARWIAEKQGGEITLSNEPDGWVEAKLVFPLAGEIARLSRALA
jgi:signal transduction histidine kinase